MIHPRLHPCISLLQVRRMIDIKDETQENNLARRKYLLFLPSVYNVQNPAKLVVDFHGAKCIERSIQQSPMTYTPYH